MNPFASASIVGNADYPNLFGTVKFYEEPSSGIWVEVVFTGLPDYTTSKRSNFYGLHIHKVGDCTQPFDQTDEHYNPDNEEHPNHAGDLPTVLSNNGYAYSLFYTNRIQPSEIYEQSIVVHRLPDDFRSQPSGNSGEKIGCGVIFRYE